MQKNWEYEVLTPLSLDDKPLPVGSSVTSEQLAAVKAEAGRLVMIGCLRPVRQLRGSVTRPTLATREELQEEVERLQSIAFGPQGGTAPRQTVQAGRSSRFEGYNPNEPDPVKPPADDDEDWAPEPRGVGVRGQAERMSLSEARIESGEALAKMLVHLRESIKEDFRAIVSGIIDGINNTTSEQLRKENESLKADLKSAQNIAAQLRATAHAAGGETEAFHPESETNDPKSSFNERGIENPPKPAPKHTHKPGGK